MRWFQIFLGSKVSRFLDFKIFRFFVFWERGEGQGFRVSGSGFGLQGWFGEGGGLFGVQGF